MLKSNVLAYSFATVTLHKSMAEITQNFTCPVIYGIWNLTNYSVICITPFPFPIYCRRKITLLMSVRMKWRSQMYLYVYWEVKQISMRAMNNYIYIEGNHTAKCKV